MLKQGPPALPPPPKPPSRWRIPLIVLAGATAGAVSLGGLYLYATHDRFELIERSENILAVESACAALSADLAGIPSGNLTTPQSRPDGIEHENEKVAMLIARVRALGPDKLDADQPLNAWLADWETLLRLRAGFAGGLRSDPSQDPPRVPTVDGYSKVKRMQDAGAVCRIPPQVLDDVTIVGKTR